MAAKKYFFHEGSIDAKLLRERMDGWVVANSSGNYFNCKIMSDSSVKEEKFKNAAHRQTDNIRIITSTHTFSLTRSLKIVSKCKSIQYTTIRLASIHIFLQIHHIDPTIPFLSAASFVFVWLAK